MRGVGGAGAGVGLGPGVGVGVVASGDVAPDPRSLAARLEEGPVEDGWQPLVPPAPASGSHSGAV